MMSQKPIKGGDLIELETTVLPDEPKRIWWSLWPLQNTF